MKKFLISASAVSLILTPIASALAVDPFNPNPPTLPSNVTTYGGVVGLMSTIANWMFGILLALAVVFLVWAAFLYLTSSGDSAKTEKAKNIIVYAIVAIVVAVLAKGIVIVVQSLVP